MKGAPKGRKVMNREEGREQKNVPLRRGTGALCAEAQADGVPCHELGRDCEVCGRALAPVDRPWPERPIGTS